MSIPQPDRPFVHWAIERGLSYYYTEEYGLPHRCLKLHSGVMTAYIHCGKLVKVIACTEGHLLDQMMYELAQLFGLCAQHDAYVEQTPCLAAPSNSTWQ